MGFVRTADELRQIETELSAPRWCGEWLSIRYLTDPDAHRRVLPPPLEPDGEPLATVTVGRWRSSCLGEFSGGVLNLTARFGDLPGAYVLALFIDAEPAITFGREVFGEPKKRATSGLVLEGDRAHAWVDRHGVRLLDLQADLGPDRGPARLERVTFNFKARTAADGRGLEEDAILTRTRFETALLEQRAGVGTVALGRGPHDPLDELGVVEVRSALFGRDDVTAHCRAIATVPAERFLPYHYGRQDDWLALAAGASPSPAVA